MRLVPRNDHPVHPDRDYVLYWMIAARRTRSSFALDHALARARELGRPLLVLEPLRIGYRWASRRLHRFVVDGMVDQRGRFAEAGVAYLPYVERSEGEGRGLLAALAARACVVVTDEYPAFFLPAMVDAAAARIPARLESVDGNGLLPLRTTSKAYPTAATFRRHLQKTLPDHLSTAPTPDPLVGYDLGRATIPADIERRWPSAADLLDDPSGLDRLPIGDLAPAPLRGGSAEGERVLDTFLDRGLDKYADHNHPDEESTSGLSPYLHFGAVSVHDVVRRVLERESWSPDRLGRPTGSRERWWGLSAPAEQFVDEVVTWRELGYGFCFHEPRFDRYDTLPGWARATLAAHAGDPRPHRYDLDALAAAATGDRIWNAAQRQLVGEGRIHGYLRMVWGKRVLEWSATPEQAWEALIELNNRYAVDGRDPNSYSGIAWTLGRFDRPWGPERPIFGVVRYMSSDNTWKKLSMTRWFAKWG
jgi:deoxyribodipyrimidine photo-lyase